MSTRSCLGIAVPLFLSACGVRGTGELPMEKKTEIRCSETEWHERLSPEQYRILRLKETERAFSGAYWDHHEKGTYRCAACQNPLFSSEDKFDSGTGWPSFTQMIEEDRVKTRTDLSHGMNRVEVVCSHCGGHLGHVFEDGPPPTGLRYCINSGSLVFEENPGEEQ